MCALSKEKELKIEVFLMWPIINVYQINANQRMIVKLADT